MLSRTAMCINHQALSRTNAVSYRMMYRSLHLTYRIRSTSVKSLPILKITKYTPVLGTCTKRYASTTESTNFSSVETPITNTISNANVSETVVAKVLDPIPDVPVPPPPTVLDTVLETAVQFDEPSFESLGLGGWTPVGVVQQCLEFLHIGLDIPWWAAIATGTLIIRMTLFPLVILSQRNAAVMSNNMPEFQSIQAKMNEARQCGDQIKTARYSQELMLFMKEKKCSPLKNIVVPLAQAPIFISCFMGLRKMAEYPVESLKTGGLWWFSDLTIPDPYYVLPLITAGTLALTIEIGTDSARAQTLGMMRYALRAIPVIIIPFTINFPGAILCYWVSSNFISLIQVGILRIPKVRTFFKIEPLKKHPPTALAPQQGFIDGFKSSIANMKSAREMNARYEADEVQFHRAGRGPLQKTFSYDPTAQLSTQKSAILAKKR